MKAVAQVDKSLSEIMYSVIEKGICRIVTSQKGKLLDKLKAAYPPNLPENHRLVWLPGNIQSIEQLSRELIAAGVPDIQPEVDADALVVQVQAHLIRCHRQHTLEIWIFEDAELLAEEIFQLLGNLIGIKHLNQSLFSLELWGNAQLDVLYHSGDLATCYGAQHYYIPVGEHILTNAQPVKTTRLLLPAVLLIVLGIGLGSAVNVWVTNGGHSFSQKKSPASELVNDLKADKAAGPTPTGTYKPIDRSQTEVTADSPTNLVVHSTPGVNSDDTADLIVNQGHVQTADNTTAAITEHTSEVTREDNVGFIAEHTQVIKVKDPVEQLTEQSALPDFKQHWFFSLDFSQWREKYKIELADDIDRQEGEFFLQLGLYRRQQSLRDFFVAEVLPAKTYYFCYQQKNNLMALITGSYKSMRQAYNAHNKLQAQCFSSFVISVNQLNDWQCSN